VEARPTPSTGERLVGVLDLLDIGAAAGVKHRGGDNQDRGIDEQRQHQRDRRIGDGPADRGAAPRLVARIGASLHDR